MQNETDAAIDRAQIWLVRQQAPDGAWGGGNPYLTALCALAVSGEGEPVAVLHQQAIARAVAWLGAHPVDFAVTNDAMHQAAAWRELALRVLASPYPLPAVPLPVPTHLLSEFAVLEVLQVRGETLPPRTQPEPDEAAEAAILAAQRQLPPEVIRVRLQAVARTWNDPAPQQWRDGQAQRAWWLARTINRHAHGVLPLGPDLALDWRSEFAGQWVNRQRTTPEGGGQWRSDNRTAIEETAFAILLLREL